MALGGGRFITPNKVLPGAYINFVSKARALVGLVRKFCREGGEPPSVCLVISWKRVFMYIVIKNSLIVMQISLLKAVKTNLQLPVDKKPNVFASHATGINAIMKLSKVRECRYEHRG